MTSSDNLLRLSDMTISSQSANYSLVTCFFKLIPGRTLAWHKFYLSFENSLCDDYITEKFFNILNSGLVDSDRQPDK